MFALEKRTMFALEKRTMEPYSVPQSMWESLEAVLHAKASQLARDIAKELHVQPQPLLAHLKAIELGKVVIIPDTEDCLYQCEAIYPHDAVFLRCKKPVFGEGPRVCSEHKGTCVNIPPNLLPVRRVNIGGTIYLLNGSFIETLSGTVCGVKKGSRFILYEQVYEQVYENDDGLDKNYQ